MRLTYRLLSLAAYRVSWRVRAGGALRRAGRRWGRPGTPIHPGERGSPAPRQLLRAARNSAGRCSAPGCRATATGYQRWRLIESVVVAG